MSIAKNKSFKSIFNLYSSGNFLKTKTKLMTIEKSPDLKYKSTNIISKTPKNIHSLNNKDEVIKELKDKIIILEEKIRLLENKLKSKKKNELRINHLSQNNSLKDIRSFMKKNSFYENPINKISRNYSNENSFNTINTYKIHNINPSKYSNTIKKYRNTSSNINKNFLTIEKDRLLKTEIKLNANLNKNLKYIPKIPKKVHSDVNVSLSSSNSLNIIKQDLKNDFNLTLKERLENIKTRTENIIKSCLNYL